jgi:hypothetical protein
MEGLEIIMCSTRSMPELITTFISQVKPFYKKGWKLSGWQIIDELMQEAPTIASVGQPVVFKMYTMVASVVGEMVKENPA